MSARFQAVLVTKVLSTTFSHVGLTMTMQSGSYSHYRGEGSEATKNIFGDIAKPICLHISTVAFAHKT